MLEHVTDRLDDIGDLRFPPKPPGGPDFPGHP